MIRDNEPLRIFVAMPGTPQSMGGKSIPWPEPENVKKFFFEKIVLQLKQDLQYEVILQIEKDKHLAGVIHDSMFAETWKSDVYIADLTGNNANVYLELGVRWAIKDNITVPVSQDVASVKFNAAYARVIPYSNNPALLERAINDVVMAIKEGLVDKNHIDSPVRSRSDIVAMSRDAIKAYENVIKQQEDEIQSLKVAQGRNLLDIAQGTKDPEQRLALYQEALKANPTFMEAYLPLAQEQRKQGLSDEALKTLKQAISLFPKNAEFYREQGVTYKKKEQLEDAATQLRTAVTLNDKDSEAWSNLGGLLREIGTKNMPYNWNILREARDSYQKALSLDDRNTYAQGNVAKLDLLLSRVDPERRAKALEELDTLEALCRLDLKKNAEDYWTWFDHADSFLLSGDVDKGSRLYQDAVRLVPLEYRESVLSSVVFPLTNLLSADVLDDAVKVAVQKIIEDLKAAQIQ